MEQCRDLCASSSWCQAFDSISSEAAKSFSSSTCNLFVASGSSPQSPGAGWVDSTNHGCGRSCGKPVAKANGNTAQQCHKKGTVTDDTSSGLNTCWKQVIACENPVMKVDSCAESSYTLERTDTKSWEVCASTGVEAGPEVVKVSVSLEVCGGQETSSATAKTEVVSIGGLPGKTTVGCAKGVAATIGDKKYVRITQTKTIRFDQCPSPICSTVNNDAHEEASSARAVFVTDLSVAFIAGGLGLFLTERA